MGAGISRCVGAVALLLTLTLAAAAQQDKIAAVEALREQGTKELLAHHPENALSLYEQALQLAESLHDPLLTGSLLVNRGNVHRQSGNVEAALADYDACLAAYEGHTPDDRSVARVHAFRATIRLDLGDFAGALADAQIALPKYQAVDDQVNVARTYNTLGTVQQQLGQFDKARDSFEHGLTLARSQKQRLGEAYLLNNIADVYLSENNPERAAIYAKQALAIKEEIGSKDDLITSQLNLSRVYQQSGHDAEALKLQQQAFATATATGHPGALAMVLFSWGSFEADEKHFAAALDKMQQALVLMRQVKDKLHESEILADIASVEVSLGKFDEAVHYAQEVIASATRMDFPQSLFDASVALGRAQQALGHLAEARTAFETAVSTNERLGENVAGGDQARSEFFSRRAEAYKGLVAVDLRLGDNEEALRISEREKGRELLDVLTHGKTLLSTHLTEPERAEELHLREHIAALEGRHDVGALDAAHLALTQFRERMYAAHPSLSQHRGEAELLTLAQTSSLLQSDRALLEYEVTPSATYLFVITSARGKPQLRVHTIAVDADTLRKRVGAFRSSIATRNPEFEAAAADLYRLLLIPAQKELQGKRALVLVPSGELWHLPFQALRTPTNHFLMEDMTLSYAPSFSVLRATKARAHVSNTHSLLLLADPQNSLPSSAHEARTLSALYGATSSTALLGAAASPDAFVRLAPQYDILHLATHGVFDDRDPMYSHLLLAGAHNTTSQLDATDVAEMDLNASLVVLSACETAAGTYQEGEGLLGMSWSFLAAGSRATVASQWRVESQSTTQLMIAFHQGLREGKSRAAALQAAQRSVSRSPNFHHPFYWAAFVLLGEP